MKTSTTSRSQATTTHRVKKAVATTATLLVIASGAAQASTETKTQTELKQGATFFVSAITGAVAGGPIGFMVGALGGAWLGDQIKQADEVDNMNESLAHATDTIEQLNHRLIGEQQQRHDMQALTTETLSLPVLFRTGSDQLSEAGRQHLLTLAGFLQKYPDYRVELSGHTDPRGTDEYNNVLSLALAESVKHVLEISGIDSQRILIFANGSSQSTASTGDLTAYAKERRVEIELVTGNSGQLVMQ